MTTSTPRRSRRLSGGRTRFPCRGRQEALGDCDPRPLKYGPVVRPHGQLYPFEVRPWNDIAAFLGDTAERHASFGTWRQSLTVIEKFAITPVRQPGTAVRPET
jgi:hypothetical protein